MPGQSKYKYPTDDELLALKANLGTWPAVAARLDIHHSTLSSHVGKRGLREKANELNMQNLDPGEKSPGSSVSPADDPQRVKITQLESALSVVKSDNTVLKKALASQEEFFDRIVQATTVPVDVPKMRSYKPSGHKPARSIITPIFDQQFGQFVVPSDTPGNRGNFSVEIFDQRLARWVDGVTSIVQKQAEAYTIREFVIPLGGDHVEGDEIYPGMPWQLELDPCSQVWELALKMDVALREVIRFAREEVGAEWVSLYGVSGNHGKVGGKRGGARPATYNWDNLFQKILFDRLRAQPVDEFAIEPGGALFFTCAGHKFQMVHGDEIKGWGGLPFYGLTKFDGRSMRLHNTLFSYLLMGHHHQPGEIPNGAGETIVSGDWVGANNLSKVITAASRPQQRVLYVSEKLGVCGSERIYFTDADEAYSPVEYYGQGAA